MAAEKKLYRSRDALIGGVCAGIAEYFDIDPIIVRIAVVVLAIISVGACAVAYVALWIILPQKPDTPFPLDISPEEVRSDIYERVIVHNGGGPGGAGQSEGSSGHGYGGVGHIPPEPPQSEAARHTNYYRVIQPMPTVVPPAGVPWSSSDHDSIPVSGSGATAQPTVVPLSPEIVSETHDSNPETQREGRENQSYTAQTTEVPSAVSATPGRTPQAPPAHPSPTERSSVKAALFIGFTLLFLGVAALLGNMIEGVYWWQFWPLIFVITGIGQMVIPGKPGRRMKHFVEGMMTCMFGLFALPISLDIVSISSLAPIFSNLWPVLVIMVGFFILGDGLKAPLFTLFAGFSFIAFCVVGLAWFSVPGSTEWIGIMLPNGDLYSIAVNSIL